MKIIIVILVSLVGSLYTANTQVIYEAEDAVFSSGKIDNKHAGFTGDGFVDTENKVNEYIEWQIHSFKEITDSVGFRYALGKDEVRSMQVLVNDALTDTIDFDNTVEFTSYEYKYTTCNIRAGINTIRLVAITEGGAPNMDHLTARLDTNMYLKLNVGVDGNGSVSVQPQADSVLYGTRVKLTANPSAGNIFNEWTGYFSSKNNPLAFTMDNHMNVTAGFAGILPAFPGAEGFGANITGGRGGEVIAVTNLNDSGEGSLRAAIETSGTRTIVFRVAGRIDLNSELSINNGNLTIAGQTAPGDGITLSGHTLKVNADNVIIRFIRSRLGDVKGSQDDALNGRKHKGIIIDHCSMSWSIDEGASFYDNTNFTMQYCIISESLYKSVHDKGTHGYGGIWGGKGATFHHNLLAHHTSRNPRFCGSRYSNQPDLERVDFRNNVIYNWGSNSIYGAEGGSYNLVNNYFKPGPATKSAVKPRIMAPNADNGSNNQPQGVWGTFFVDGNYVLGSSHVTENNWNGVHVNSSFVDQIKSSEEYSFDEVTTHTADLAFEHVMAQAGCILPQRDAVDKRIINETLTGTASFGGSYGTATGIIDSQEDVGGWPALNAGTPPADSDGDGMPDEWEIAQGLNPDDPDDRNDDANSDGYTNLEAYLNELVQKHTYLLRPLNLSAELINTGQLTLTWDDVTTTETGFLVERKTNDNAFEEVASLPENTETYTDNTLTNDVFSYRVRAINHSDTSFYTDTVTISLLTHVRNIEEKIPGLMVSPNPIQNKVSLTFTTIPASGVSINLYNTVGQKMEVVKQVKNQQIYFDASHVPPGMYVLVVSTSDGSETRKLIKN